MVSQMATSRAPIIYLVKKGLKSTYRRMHEVEYPETEMEDPEVRAEATLRTVAEPTTVFQGSDPSSKYMPQSSCSLSYSVIVRETCAPSLEYPDDTVCLM
jgi:hypothetical protein